MARELQYTSSIKDMPFMFSEMCRTAQLLCEGKNSDEIVAMSIQSNIYQLEREKRRRDVPLRMIKRLSTLDDSLISVIATGSERDAKVIAFLALIKADRLFFEYMREVYLDRYEAGRFEISDKDFIGFIERKAQSSDVVAKWTSNNLVRIRNTYKNILCEAGLAKRNGDVLLIQKPLIDHALLGLLDRDDVLYAKAMLLEA
ncbi:MAG: DUF1819 family protein [Peptococcaceae bacterium]|nr:DUF1819 family protein [Peptococcaceae bacterium]